MIFQLLRIDHYIKNFFVFLPIFFSGQLLDGQVLLVNINIFVAFCCASSSIYIINDYFDRFEDQKHPKKCARPIASGAVSHKVAIAIAMILACSSLGIAYTSAGKNSILIVGSYILLNCAYSMYLKHFSIIDVVCISLGFVFRVVGGAVASSVVPSQWLLLIVFLMCIFLGLSKRWDDIYLNDTQQTQGTVRKSLQGYTKPFLAATMTFFATLSCICYIMYTLNSNFQHNFNSTYLYLTIFWIILGQMRYFQLIFNEFNSGSPTKIILKDNFIRMIIVFWIIHIFLLIYS